MNQFIQELIEDQNNYQPPVEVELIDRQGNTVILTTVSRIQKVISKATTVKELKRELLDFIDNFDGYGSINNKIVEITEKIMDLDQNFDYAEFINNVNNYIVKK